MKTSRLTSKYQATIPKDVRGRLGLKAGDSIVFQIEGEEVKIRKATPLDLAFAEALAPTLSEWESQADDEAYGGL